MNTNCKQKCLAVKLWGELLFPQEFSKKKKQQSYKIRMYENSWVESYFFPLVKDKDWAEASSPIQKSMQEPILLLFQHIVYA